MMRTDSYAEDVAALQEMAREFTEGFNSGDVERLMRFYGNSYVDVNLRQPVQSHEERKEYYTQVIRRLAGRIQVHPDEIVVHGDIALVRGRIELIRRDVAGTALTTTELRYLEIARKGPDGWKAVWGIDGPVQEYEPNLPLEEQKAIGNSPAPSDSAT
jgi:ketosteroid isomerase-like protein